jgi:Calcineurin-like phosphoesterase
MKSVYFILTAFLFLPSLIVRSNDFANERSTVLSVNTNLLSVNTSTLIFGIPSEDYSNENLSSLAPSALTRGPYLQVGTQTSIIIRWRTDIAENSRVSWGTVFGTYPNLVDSTTSTTEHIVQISGLTPDNKYWYTIGSTTQTLQATITNYFLTLPPSNTTRKLRFLALGDCGNNSTNQVNVKNTFINYIGSNDIDAMILLGDNAYSFGTDAEYQTNFFNIYEDDLLKYYKLYPAPGNHDYGNSSANTGRTGATPALSMPYHLNFTVPSAGQNGGVASNVKNYYSYNIGDVHFISLDSYGRDNGNTTKMYDTSGAQATWLKADLAANTKKWTVAYFHHPPYTKTSHSSDYNGGAGELDLVAIRERFVRILERNGVDLILCGHSHGYERSYLLKNFYNTYASPLDDANFSAATHTATGNTQNGKYDGTANSCAFAYNSGQYNHGSMYIVSGSAGQVGGTTAGYPQNCMYYSNPTNGGCLYFEVDSNRLDVKFVSYTTSPTPVIRDQFTIFKDVNKSQNINAVINDPVTLTASWKGTYYWPNNGGATTRSVTVNNDAIGTYAYTVRDANTGSCIQDVFNITVSGTVPVMFRYFNATLNNDKVVLEWSTSQENNNKYFTIEKSNDGINFSFLGKVNGAGTSSVSHTYQLMDYTPGDGVNYYRLSQTDYDGNTNNYEVKTVNYKSSKNFSAVILNNGNGQVRVVVKHTNATMISMKVVDLVGKEILQQSFSVNNGGAVRDIYLNRGIYILVLTNSRQERISNKIIVR